MTRSDHQHEPAGLVGSPPFKALVLLLVLLLLAESGLQVSKYAQSRQGLIALLRGETRFVTDEDSGLLILNPRYSLPGFFVNSFGIRSDELPQQGQDSQGKVLAFIGASTVMGEVATHNADRFSEILVRSLNDLGVGSFLHVNAGIAGFRLIDQKRMLDRLSRRIPIDMVFIYPGFNNVSDYCSPRPQKSKTASFTVPALSLPEWWLTWDAVRRRTGWLRPSTMPAVKAAPSGSDLELFKTQLDALLLSARQSAKTVIVMSSARSFVIEQPVGLQEERAASLRPFTSCFNMNELNQTIDAHNAAIQAAAKQHGLMYMDAAALMNGKTQYFEDATHFSRSGETFLAGAMKRFLSEQKLIQLKQHP